MSKWILIVALASMVVDMGVICWWFYANGKWQARQHIIDTLKATPERTEVERRYMTDVLFPRRMK